MAGQPKIIVAGDVCIDWLSVPLDPVSLNTEESGPQNWQLRGGRRMYARHGGAWLTAHLTSECAGPRATVSGPQRFRQEELDSISPDQLIHSMVMLDRCLRDPAGKNPVVGVSAFEGFAGPGSAESLMSIPLVDDAAEADVVVLDDAGNGFRDDESRWPQTLRHNDPPVILYKLRQPLEGSNLGKFLRAQSLSSNTIALLNVEELRAESDGTISRALSWERTATEVVEALHRTPQLYRLLDFAHLVIPLGLEAVLQVEGGHDRVGQACLFYSPDWIEGDIVAQSCGTMTGFASAFAAALAAELAGVPESARPRRETIGRGIRKGMSAGWRLFEVGFGQCGKDGTIKPPDYPGAEIFQPVQDDEFRIDAVVLNPYPQRMDPAALRSIPADEQQDAIASQFDADLKQFRAWRILQTTPERPYAQLAAEVVRRGLKKVLPDVPVAAFGALELIDRQEIESYRTIRNLIREFLANSRPERPLCLAVFGRPGDGKSFGVVQVAKTLAAETRDAGDIEKYSFNVSQWQSPDDLAHALHHVRDGALRGNVPLVFFDEFDCNYAEQKLGWLKYFLAPMQDGVFNDGVLTHEIGRAIFVFAGGTSFSFDEFQSKALAETDSGTSPTGDADPRTAKAPDFLSRLRGYVDVLGVAAPPVGPQLVRRAIILRSLLARKCKHMFDAKTGEARVSASVLRAFLIAGEYRHGIRSMEAILEMSRLDQAAEFTASLLPPAEQLKLHVSPAEFNRLLDVNLDLGAELDQLARFAHEEFVRGQKDRRDAAHPSMQPWEDLIPLYKNSNREQAAHIAVKLASIGCAAVRDAPSDPFRFTNDEIERLARMEHERWMDERRVVQPDHEALVPWKELAEEIKEMNRKYIRSLPDQLDRVGLKIMRLP